MAVPPWGVLLACLGLGACAALPTSAPTEREVMDAEQGGRNPVGFRIVDVTPAVLAALDAARPAAPPGLVTLDSDLPPLPPVPHPRRAGKGRNRGDDAGVGRSAYVLGDVRTPGRQPLSRNGERVLDVVALRGGSTTPSQDTVVQLTRDGRNAQVPLLRVEQDARENILLRPGDRIRLTRRVRSFTAFGAAGKVAEVPLEAAEVSLAEAVARTGGPANDRADPNAVFLFRFEAAAVAEALGLPLPFAPRASDAQPIVYRLDLLNPSSYFLAQRFAVRDKDVLLVANARADRVQKLIAIISSVASPYLDSR